MNDNPESTLDNVIPISAQAQTPERALREILARIEQGKSPAKAMVLILADDIKTGSDIDFFSVGCSDVETFGLITRATVRFAGMLPG